jgi:hypothetical protein
MPTIKSQKLLEAVVQGLKRWRFYRVAEAGALSGDWPPTREDSGPCYHSAKWQRSCRLRLLAGDSDLKKHFSVCSERERLGLACPSAHVFIADLDCSTDDDCTRLVPRR